LIGSWNSSLNLIRAHHKLWFDWVLEFKLKVDWSSDFTLWCDWSWELFMFKLDWSFEFETLFKVCHLKIQYNLKFFGKLKALRLIKLTTYLIWILKKIQKNYFTLERHPQRNRPCTYRNRCLPPMLPHHRHTFCRICRANTTRTKENYQKNPKIKFK